MLSLVHELRASVSQILQGGGEKSRSRHTSQGKLLVRDRIDTLLDPDSAFLELSQIAAFNVYEDEIPSAGIVSGIGKVSE